MDPLTLSAIIGAAGSAASDLGTAFGGLALQNKYNRDMADLQNQYNIEMWNRQNEYNHPVQQMNRLREAGLNPNLMYSQGNVGNASSAPQKSAPNAPDAQSAMRDAARAINPLQLAEFVIKLRKDLADAESAEQRANILGIQGLISGSEVDALLNPLYEVDLKGNISKNKNYSVSVLSDPNNRYFSIGSGIGSEYFSLLNALQVQKQIVGSNAKVISAGKTAAESRRLQKELDWYDANQMSGIFGKFTPIINSLLLNLLKN